MKTYYSQFSYNLNAMSKQVSRTFLQLNFFLIIAAASANVLFGLLKFVNLLHIVSYYGYNPLVIDVAIFSPTVDLWIWGSSVLFILLEAFLMSTLHKASFPRWTLFPFLLSIASLAVFPFNGGIAYLTIPLGFIIVGLSIYYGNGYLVTRRKEALSLMLTCIMGLLVLFELVSVSIWMVHSVDHEIPFSSSSLSTLRWKFPWIDFQLFNVFYPLTSWLFLLFLYSWIWIPVLKYALSRIPAFKLKLPRILQSNPSPVPQSDGFRSPLKVDKKFLPLGLLLSSVAAAFIAYYPYIRLRGFASPFGIPVGGVDAFSYYGWLKDMVQNGPFVAFSTDRPVFNLFMYFVKYVTGWSIASVIEVISVLLAVSLSLAVFWLVKVGTKSRFLALMASLLSSFSFVTTVGVYADLLTNWFAIVEVLLLLVFLLKGLEKHSWRYASISALIGMAVLLTHPYTWDFLIVILAVYLIWSFLRKRDRVKFEIVLLIFLLAANLLFFVGYTLSPIGKGATGATSLVVNTVASNFSILNVLNLQSGLASMVQDWVGNLFGNPMLIALGIVGVFSMMDFTKRFNRMMLLWVAIPSLVLMVTPQELYFRIMYIIPLQIQATVGLYYVFSKIEDTKGNFKTSKIFQILKILIIILFVLFLLNYALRSVDLLTV